MQRKQEAQRHRGLPGNTLVFPAFRSRQDDRVGRHHQIQAGRRQEIGLLLQSRAEDRGLEAARRGRRGAVPGDVHGPVPLLQRDVVGREHAGLLRRRDRAQPGPAPREVRPRARGLHEDRHRRRQPGGLHPEDQGVIRQDHRVQVQHLRSEPPHPRVRGRQGDVVQDGHAHRVRLPRSGERDGQDLRRQLHRGVLVGRDVQVQGRVRQGRQEARTLHQHVTAPVGGGRQVPHGRPRRIRGTHHQPRPDRHRRRGLREAAVHHGHRQQGGGAQVHRDLQHPEDGRGRRHHRVLLRVRHRLLRHTGTPPRSTT